MDTELQQELRTDVELLKRDVQSINQVIDKLDLTIDKLAEVSNGLNRMITVHETQITRHGEADKELFQLVEMRRKESDENDKILHQRISEQREELEDRIESVYSDIANELKAMREEQAEHHKFVSERLTLLEQWKWYAAGIIAFLVFIASIIPWENFF